MSGKIILVILSFLYSTAHGQTIHTTITSTNTRYSIATVTEYSNSSKITSFFSETQGPWLDAVSYTWSQYIWPKTVGTVEVVVNKDTNKTLTTTKTNIEYQNNGTFQIGLTRTDTNAAGTVTHTAHAPGHNGSSIVVAYPTPAMALDTAFTWVAVLPTHYNGSICCESQDTSSATPSHTIFATPTGSTNTLDPSGWLYTLTKVESFKRLSATEISSLWANQSIGFPYTGCSYTSCIWSTATVDAAQFASSVAYLFATTTITTSGPNSASLATVTPASATPSEHSSATVSVDTSPGATSSEHSTSVVDPITARLKSLVVVPTHISSEYLDSDIKSSTTGSTVVQLPSSAPNNVQQGTTRLSTSTETLQSRTTQAALPSTPNENTDGQNGGEQGNELESSAGLHAPVPSSLLAESTAGGSPVTLQSRPSEPPTPATIEPISSSTGQFVTTSLTLVLASSVTSGEASFTTMFVFVTRPPETTLQAGPSSVVPQISNAVIDTGSPTNLVQITTSSAAALPQDTASSEQLVPGPSVSVTGGDSHVTNLQSTENVAAIVVGGSTITPDASSQYIVSEQSLLSGSSITLVQGSSTAVIALPTGQPELATSLLVTGVAPKIAATKSAMPIVVGSNTITPDVSSKYVVSGQTLAAGSEITLVSGTSSAVVALRTSDSQTYLVVGTSTSTLLKQTAFAGSTQPPAFTIGSAVITPNSASEYVVASQTLRPGAAITISGSVISLASHATEIVIGTSTQTAAYNQGLGGYIWSALGAASTTAPISASGREDTSSDTPPGSPGSRNTGASQQSSTITGGSGSSTTSTPANLGGQTTSASSAVQLRSDGVGLVVFLCVIAFVIA